MVGTLLLLSLVYFIFIAVLAYLGIESLVILAIVAMMLGIQYFLSDRLVLLSLGARVVSEQEEPHLYEMLTRLSALTGTPRPKLALVDSAVPNAFATGRNPRNSVIGVTRSLVRMLEPDELEAVIAHELSHVRNRDVMVITLASFLSTVAFIIFRNWIFFGAGSRGSGKASPWWLIPIFAAAVWFASYLLINALSRYRELSADRGSAVLTGQPSHLATALMKISGMMERVPTKDLREVEGMNAFFIVPVHSGSSILALFSTHPPVEQRITALERLQREMGA